MGIQDNNTSEMWNTNEANSTRNHNLVRQNTTPVKRETVQEITILIDIKTTPVKRKIKKNDENVDIYFSAHDLFLK
jgi:hypothetical protein